MANFYNKGLAYLNGAGDWTAGGTTFKMALVTSTYTFNADHNFFSDITNEITNGGYTAGGNAMTTRAITENDTNDRAELTSDNVTFSALAAGDQPDQAIIYRDSGVASTSELICRCALTSPPSPNGGDYTVNQPAAGWGNFAN